MNNTPRIEKLLSVLGYEGNVKYYSLDKFSSLPSASHLTRIFHRINENEQAQFEDADIRIHGAYFIQTDLDTEDGLNLRPVIFIATANDVSEAREIHRSLWLSNSAPFVIVLMPDQIRVYAGFDFDRENENQGFIDRIELQEFNLFGDLAPAVIEAVEKYSSKAIDEGSIWQILKNSDRFNYDNRLDKRLLKSLRDLEEILFERLHSILNTKAKSEILEYIHPLIGKYVYFQYLKDRKILTKDWAIKQGIDLDKVLDRGATLSELLKLDRAIEDRFEGNIFPFPQGFEQDFPEELIKLVAAVFCGDTAYGQGVLFDIYDFSYIPVETLSYIYEQFLRSLGVTKNDGAVYTPESLADYLINEINVIKPLKRKMKILDPCCGSGIFLVLTYRYLIELELHNLNVKMLPPYELKKIMEESIHGVELNLEACYVTEFSLILILLDYIEPPDLDKNNDFKFPNLHEKNIFQGNFFDPNKEFYPLTMTFDWIIGNPPWKGLDLKINPNDKEALDWVISNEKRFPVGDKRIEEAFAWRATEFVAIDGCIAFVLPAKRLFNSKSTSFRKEFFRKNEVHRITNFSNFHYLLFQADVSAITIVYQKATEGKEKNPIWHYSPFVANQIAAQLKKGNPTRPVWAIVINKNEIKRISQKEAEEGNALTWKMASWGTYEDERTYKRLRSSFTQNFISIVKKKKWKLHKGLELRNQVEQSKRVNKTDDPIVPIDEWIFETYGKDLKILDGKRLNNTNYRFSISPQALVSIPPEMRFVRQGRKIGYKTIPAPHAVLHAQFAIYSDEDFAIGSHYAVAAPKEDADYLKAISLYLCSSLCRYLLFFTNPQWGIDRTTISKKDWKDLAVPSFTESQIKLLSNLHKELVLAERNGEKIKTLQERLDDAIEGVLEIPPSIRYIVHDFFDVKLTLNKGKTQGVKAVRLTTYDELERYAEKLRNELDEFAEGGNERHIVFMIQSNDLTVCRVSIVETDAQQPVQVKSANKEWKEELENIKKGIQEEFSQWVYIQRELRFFDLSGENIYMCKSSRLIDWTESQAISDANDIIGETLAKINMNFNSFLHPNNYGHTPNVPTK